MKKIDLGQIVTILANIGVIAGIVFLGIEIRENSTQARIATTQEVIAQRSEWRELIASDQVLSDVYARGLADFAALTPAEQSRFSVLMEAFIFKMSGNLTARNASLVGTNENFEARSLEGDLLRMLDQPGFQQWWAEADRRGLPASVIELTEQLKEMGTTGSVAQ